MKTKFIILLCLVSFLVFSQQKQDEKQRIKLKNAEFIATDEDIAPGIQMLIGSVKMEHDGAILTCDSAAFNRTLNTLETFGSVKIVEGDTLSIICDSMYYDGNQRYAQAKGNVILKTDQIELFTDTLDYDRQEQRAYYFTRSKIIKESMTIDSDIGVYFMNDNKVDFYSNVVVVDEDFQLEGDSLYYNTVSDDVDFDGPTIITNSSDKITSDQGRYNLKTDRADFSKNTIIYKDDRTLSGDTLHYEKNNNFASFKGNVKVRDFVQKTAIYADYGEAYEAYDSIIFTKKPRIAYLGEKDTLFMRSDTLIATQKVDAENDTTKFIRAFYNVRYFKSDIQGRTDSLFSNQKTGKMNMYGSPVMWANDSQISADTLILKRDMEQDMMDSLYLNNNAFIASPDKKDTISFNQISGRHLKGKFIEDDLRRVFVTGNAETVFFAEDDNEKRIGINKTTSSYMDIKLFDSEIISINFIQKPDATMFPENELKIEDRFLKQYTNRSKERPPNRESVWGGTIPKKLLE